MRYVCLIALLTLGCHGEVSREHVAKHDAAKAPTAVEAKSTGGVGTGGNTALPEQGALQRKIIYTADVQLGVEDFDDVFLQVKELVKRFGAYVARSNITGLPGSRRSGQWTIRVPVANYEDLLAAARGLAEVRSVRSNSSDVSEEYYDVEARVRNKKVEEERLRKHLDESTARLDDILAVEREISRVREEIERMQGRLRVLGDLTALATINLQIDEIQRYVPQEAPGYLTRVHRALDGSTTALVATAQGVSIAIVAALPWLIVAAVMAVFLLALVRLARRLASRRAG